MGKFIVLLVVVFLIVWLVRGGRPGRSVPGPTTPPTPPANTANSDNPAAPPDTIVACAHCGLHLPKADALPGRGGVFCGEAHRAEFERAQAPR
ncbi:PP0621 family protein [Rhizobacter sp. OV335]|uniref:PP0621 family protein n=1 Tax=Rhizobacter sp. OV335 TaxID=1500264 RepID=UPI0009223843|nr:PP0621 family protein [Rhizobacter sp. OV335]SHM24722.1 uncharacterized protein SAMN02787076_00829 [Rhizobacter sp. OV335]